MIQECEIIILFHFGSNLLLYVILQLRHFKQKMKQELFLRMDRLKEFTRKYQIEPDLKKWITIGMNAEYFPEIRLLEKARFLC